MAIITCPGCDRDVWDGEESCPTCSYALKESTNKVNMELFVSLKKRLVLLSAVAGSCLFALLVSMVRPPDGGFGTPVIIVGLIYLATLLAKVSAKKQLADLEED